MANAGMSQLSRLTDINQIMACSEILAIDIDSAFTHVEFTEERSSSWVANQPRTDTPPPSNLDVW